MSLLDLVKDLADRGIRLAPAPGGLAIDGPRDALTPDLLARLSVHKPELVALLRHPQPDAAATWLTALDRLADDALFPADVLAALRAAEVQWSPPLAHHPVLIDGVPPYRYHAFIMASVVLTGEAALQLGKLPKNIKARMAELLARLANWPNVSGAKALTGDLAGHFRLRTGDYRLQFRVDKGQAVVEQIGHRDGFYDGD